MLIGGPLTSFIRKACAWAEEPGRWGTIGAAAALGAATAVATFGTGYLIGTSTFWEYPVGDAGMMLNGWSYFLHEPWHWPLAHCGMTNGPQGLNILYLDAVPLVAMASKLVHTVAGSNANPYGLWHLAVYVLQAVLAALLARRLGLRSLLATTGLALLCLSMHAFVMRFYHEGLNGHFVILWALLAYLRSDATRRWWALAAEWTAVLAVSVLLHPYLLVMVSPFFVAATFRVGRQARGSAALAAAGSSALVVLVLVACGYLPSRLPADPGEFGLTSMNLMSLVVPYMSSLSPWLPDPSLQNATGVQWDGYNFLGIGVLALLLMAMVLAWRPLLAATRRHALLAAGVAVLALYAPSNRWFVGQHLLLEYRIPERLGPLTANFRATGRFFWPCAYVLLVGAAVVCARRLAPRYAGVVLFAVGLAQFIDAGATRKMVSDSVAHPWARRLDWAQWAAVMHDADQVDILPSYNCWAGKPVTNELLMKEREIEFVAAHSGKRTNGGRTARLLLDCAREAADVEVTLSGTSHRPGHLYVFMTAAFPADTLSGVRHRLGCHELPDALVCSDP